MFIKLILLYLQFARQCLDVTEPSPEPTQPLLPCLGVREPHLQIYARIPLPDHSDVYYLHVTYQQVAQRMSCATVIRSHECAGTVEIGDICRPCTESKRLVERKHERSIASTTREIKKCTPLSSLSKTRVAEALVQSRRDINQMEKELGKIRKQLEEDYVKVSLQTHQGLASIMETCEKSSFIELFWSEQKKAFDRKPGGMRWHPMMLRFAIMIHTQSPSTYRSLREVGVLKLPSESTLRDYTNVLHPSSGFKKEVFLELGKQADGLSDQERWVTLLHDEISIKSDLVYDRVTGELVGFLDSDSWNEKTARDGHLATHALVFMVVGITSNIKMSVGYFPTRTATADEIFPLLWRAIGLIECVSNLKVRVQSNNMHIIEPDWQN